MVDAVNKGLAPSTPIRAPAAQDTANIRATKSIAQTILNGTPATTKSKSSASLQFAKDASPPPANLPRGSIIDELV